MLTLLPSDPHVLATLPPVRMAQALARLREDGEKAIAAGMYSVTTEERLPPSGDGHDYRSWGSYWWPDPEKADGLPWIRRDGVLHPDAHRGNRQDMDKMVIAVRRLALAYHALGEARYAEHAGLLLRTWFLDAATRMNPHLRYAQAIPGRCEGRGIGLIDTRVLIWIPDAVRLLRGSDAWLETDDVQLRRWFEQYAQWLLTSDLGHDEAREANNHGSYYDLQLAAYALFVGNRQVSRAAVERLAVQRVLTLVQADGSVTHELTRTRSFDYVLFHLRGLLLGLHLGRQFGMDLVSRGTASGDRLRAAVDWLEPYVATQERWPGKQLEGFRRARMGETLSVAAWVLEEAKYAGWLERLGEDRAGAEYILDVEAEL